MISKKTVKQQFKKLLIPDLEPALHMILLILIVIFVGSIYLAFYKIEIATSIAIESASLIFTIFIVGYIYEQRAQRDLKYRLVRQVGSSDNGFALNALAELDAYDWLRQKSIFQGAWLRRANLKDAVAWGVDFSGAQLEEANFEQADLTASKFIVVDLRLCMFNKATLVGAEFKADLYKASFKEAYLQNANFDNCTLSHVNFSAANLQGAKFKNCDVENVRWEGAFYNNETRFPANINPKEVGAIFIKELMPVVNKKYL